MRRLVLASSLFVIAVAATAQTTPCPEPDPSGPDFSGQNLTDRNFSQQDLSEANFQGAILDGAQFIGANLTGANFSRASLKKSAHGAANFLNANLASACFQDAKLEGTNLQFTTVTCTDFSGSDLTGALFAARPRIDVQQRCRTKFIRATMKIHQVPTSLWGHTDFTNTNFVGLTPESFSLRGVDITNAMLAGIRLAKFDLTGSTLTGVDFTSADLRNAKLDRVRAAAATFLGATAVGADFSNADLTGANLRGANFSASKFTNAILDRAALQPDKDWNATQILGADFSGATFRSAHLNNVSFQNTRLHGARIQGQLEGTDFSHAKLTNATFESPTTLQGVSFVRSSLENVSFQNTKMQPIPVSGLGVNFSCAYLGGANFSSAEITTASFNNAVMLRPDDCCPQSDGTYFCGIDACTQQPYGTTSLPPLPEGVVVTCPNGDQARCDGDQWSVPDWQSSACGQGPLERIWTRPACGGGDEIDIPDEALLECLRLEIFGSLPITPDRAAEVTEIRCSGRGIENAAGLEEFTGLQTLDLSYNRLKSLSLSQLSALHHLDASHNQIECTITGWVAPNDLRYLDLSYNQLTELELDIQHDLFHVDLSHNRLTDVGPLGDLRSLVSLNLQNNALTTIGSLRRLTGTLQNLNLACNREFDCGSLEIDGTPLLDNSSCGKCRR